MGSNCARTIYWRFTLNRHPTTETRVAYDNSTWHAINRLQGTYTPPRRHCMLQCTRGIKKYFIERMLQCTRGEIIPLLSVFYSAKEREIIALLSKNMLQCSWGGRDIHFMECVRQSRLFCSWKSFFIYSLYNTLTAFHETGTIRAHFATCFSSVSAESLDLPKHINALPS